MKVGRICVKSLYSRENGVFREKFKRFDLAGPPFGYAHIYQASIHRSVEVIEKVGKYTIDVRVVDAMLFLR